MSSNKRKWYTTIGASIAIVICTVLSGYLGVKLPCQEIGGTLDGDLHFSTCTAENSAADPGPIVWSCIDGKGLPS